MLHEYTWIQSINTEKMIQQQVKKYNYLVLWIRSTDPARDNILRFGN